MSTSEIGRSVNSQRYPDYRLDKASPFDSSSRTAAPYLAADFYRSGADHLEYQPDFVAEATDAIYMLEPKARNELQAEDVQAKKAAAVRWCERASEFAAANKGKLWHYVLIPHDAIAENITLSALAEQFVTRA